MEVRHHGVDELEIKPGAYEESGFAGPEGGGADGGDTPSPGGPCRVKRL